MEGGLPDDLREFLSLLRSHGVESLLIGGHAVIGQEGSWIASRVAPPCPAS